MSCDQNNLSYEVPQVEIIELEIEQNILTSSNTEGFGGWQN